METVSLPSTLTSIGEFAFSFCTGLTVDLDNDIPSDVTIGTSAFNQVKLLKGSILNTAADNSGIKKHLASAHRANVTLAGRTLYKDGKWNTLCLPFDVTDGDSEDNITFSDTPLEGATVMELDVDNYYNNEGNLWPGSIGYDGYHKTGLDGGTLYLNFKTATSIEAGKPYLIKWASGTNLTESNLVFSNVSVSEDMHPATSADQKVTFKGTYSQQTWSTESPSILLVGANDNLYWPSGTSASTLGACRAYFDLGGYQARAFHLNFFDGETSGITTTNVTNSTNVGEGWYTVNGVKLDKKPTMKGLYIHGGHKITIK